ncbi:protein DGCR14 [Geosmithia morbida]|uniref:Protein DGCR14 n=1 Tax=Geosmithia morbida TaxID=1094350 RepID=A0A9P4YQZ3_9HYPO|nr:protein DGCR14 [Geosmithia morbida]KAF4120202.1 protein DGCR14 [Geosmithia morbida]
MNSLQTPSKALVRKRPADMALMPPPPQIRKIKRPKKVLDEDSYTDALSRIIARDFFPGLLETETKQEYLDALESKDEAWILSAGRRLQSVMTPGRGGRSRNTPATKRTLGDAAQTPTTYVGDTPASAAPSVRTARDAPPGLDVGMSLSKFQETYTSEDNESFYKLVDKQNQKRADKYAWLWRGNKLPSKQMIKQKEVQDRLAQQGRLIDDGYMKKSGRLAIKDSSDDRPAKPDHWNSAPRNSLMYGPENMEDGVPTVADRQAQASRMGPRTIVYENTRIPEPHVPKRPPSPTASSIRDAVAGRPRAKDLDSGVVGGGETPRVNGYSFVDDEDDNEDATGPSPRIDLGSGDAHNPFKIQGQRDREMLHERMVERIAKNNKEASRHGLLGKADKTLVPKFPSSPRVTGNLTPAAQRLLSQLGPGKNKTPGATFGQSTPMKPRGSLLRSVRGTPTPSVKP